MVGILNLGKAFSADGDVLQDWPKPMDWKELIAIIHKTINKALFSAWIFVGSALPVAVTLWTAASLFVACSSDSAEPKDTTPPTIMLNQAEVEVTGGKEVRISEAQLFVGDALAASWKDDVSKKCTVQLYLNGKNISSGTALSEEWALGVKVSDEAGNSQNAEIKLTVQYSWLENLKNVSLQVDQETDLLNGITFGNGAKLEKVEIEIDGQKIEISDPHHYTPSYPWTCSIMLTIKDKDGNIVEHKADNLTIKPLDYQAVEINDIKPVDILPIIGQVTIWDKDCYSHIEHLRLAEATIIRDMMWQYGAGNHSPAEYQQLMSRLNTGMFDEIPEWYNNYEFLCQQKEVKPSNHAHSERSILNSLINHANFKISLPLDLETFYNTISNHDNVYIMWQSMLWEVPYNEYASNEKIKKLIKSKNFIRVVAWTNVRNWHTKIYQEDVDNNDIYGIKGLPSSANWKNDEILDRHIMVTIGTNKDGNADITNKTNQTSKFPIWFHPKVLFSWRMFPFHDLWYNSIVASIGEYPTSDANYLNVAMTDLCFQMFAEVKDVDELLEMIRSTCLTDYIHLNWETQELQLINPAWFFQKYLMPTKLPTSAKSNATVSLSKGYYKGVIFDIPGAEVKVNGKWITYTDANKAQIKAQNPMNLEWRLNGELCKKMGYGAGKTLKGKVIVVDDNWNGLNMTKEFSITLSS